MGPFSEVRPSRCSRLTSMKSSLHRTKLLRALILIVLVLVAVVVGAWLYGAYRLNSETQDLRARLDAARVPIRPQTVDLRELEGLPAPRSEEHTSELQSRQYLVCRLLLEKKKTNTLHP